MHSSISSITVAELYSRYKQQREAGQFVSLEEVCRDYPHLLGQVRRIAEADKRLPEEAPVGSPAEPMDAETILRHQSVTPGDDPPEEPTRDLPQSPVHADDMAPTASFHPTAQRMEVDLPPSIPGYRIGAILGNGGMGAVWEATKVNLPDTTFALKVIRLNRFGDRMVTRFRREAAILSRLDHPNIVRIFEYNECDDGPYLTMRLLRGGTLHERMAEFQGDCAKAVRLMTSIAGAVAFVHRLKLDDDRSYCLLHRDIKPSNVLFDKVGEDATPYLTDFGLVRETIGENQGDDPTGDSKNRRRGHLGTLTLGGGVMGTPQYMPLESLCGDDTRIGPPADVFALGIMLYELTVCRRPFEGSLLTEMKAILRDTAVPPPSSIVPDFDSRLEAIILKCLQREPEARFQDAHELTEALKRWQQERVEAQQANPLPTPKRYRSNGLQIGAACLVVIATLALYFFVVRQDEPIRLSEQKTELARIAADLETRNEVDLFNEDGALRWSEWVAGPVQPRMGNRTIEFNNTFVSMLELVRNVPAGYRFELEIQHLPGTGGYVGVYLGRSIQPAQNGPHHCVLLLRLSDEGGFAPKDKNVGVVSMAASGCQTESPKGFAASSAFASAFVPKPQGKVRKVIIEFTQKELIVTVDTHRFDPVSRNRLLRFASEIGIVRPAELGALTPTFRPDEGIGIYVHGGGIRLCSAKLIKAIP